MNVLYRGARIIKDMYNQLNPATLTGAIDVLVIEHENEELCASPFHVRFGKLGVLRAKEKLVNIMINDEEVGLHMKLGDQGEAFFVVETDDEEIPLRLLTSPLPSRPASPHPEEPPDAKNKHTVSREDCTAKRKRRKRRKRKSLTSSELSAEYSQSDSEEENANQICHGLRSLERDLIRKCPSESNVQMKEPHLSVDSEGTDEDDAPYNRLCTVFSDSELPLSNKENDLMTDGGSPFSDTEAMDRKEMVSPIGWDWGQLPGDEGNSSGPNALIPSNISTLTIEDENHRLKLPQQLNTNRTQSKYSPPPEVTPNSDVAMSESPKLSENKPSLLSSKESSPVKNNKKSKQPTEGLYLDEILDLDPNLADLYFSPTNKEDDGNASKVAAKSPDGGMDNARSRTPETTFLGLDAGVDSGTDCLISDDVGESAEWNFYPMKMSLCGGRLESGKLTVDEEKFNEKLITYEQFLEDPIGITNNTELIIQIAERYCDWQTAGPLLLSIGVFKKPLSQATVERMIDKQTSKKLRASSGGRLSWLWRRSSHRESTGSNHSEQGTSKNTRSKEATDGSNIPRANLLSKSYSASPTVQLSQKLDSNENDESSSCEDEVAKYVKGQKFKRAQTVQNLYPMPTTKTMKKTTRLTSEQLKSLNLKPGANEISFSVTTQYQGTSRCYATVYLWKSTDKLVVSDIDGTITKSDVFGQILPVVGKDWTQGGVAPLYHNISKNGYKFIYLSARAIGQAGMTKGYLNWINQQGVSLPAGPLFLTPTSLMTAFHTEVIEKKPEKFKIQCLHDISALFPDGAHPLVAGFGNKANDVLAYGTVGIPKKRIFTINHRGELKQEDLQTYTTSYSELGDIVDTFFPALDSQQCKEFSDTHEFSTFNYWRTDMPDITQDLENF